LRKIYDTESNIECELITYALDNIVECDDGIAPGIAEPRESPSAIINHEIGTIHGNSGAD